MSGALHLRRAGPWVTLQDLGRPGLQRYGVSESGAMDPVSLVAANRLVGNPDGAAALEIGLLGAELEVEGGPLTLAVAGPGVTLAIDGRAVEANRGHTLQAGAVLTVRLAGAAYTYLTVHGGFDRAPALGSRSFHARSGIGGPPLAQGDALPVLGGRHPEMRLVGGLPHDDAADRPIRLVPGPQDDFFEDAAWEVLLGAGWRIGARSDRMGIRLDGPAIPHGPRGYNIVSDGIAPGSVQVPGNGQPIVLGADRQTTGGYPKIGVVARADLFRFVQTPPGGGVRFETMTVERAVAALAGLRQRIAELRLEPAVDDLASERLLSLNLIDGVVAR